MSKKKKQIVFEELGKKNQIFDFKNYLEANSMDQTRFFCFTKEDFLEKQNKIITEKIKIDYQTLLQKNFQVFWSTAKFNTSFQQALESFLYYGKIKYIPQIHELMFKIFHRIIFHQQENEDLSRSFNIENVIYDEFLIDVPKFFDLIQIFPNNKKIIKQMIQTTFNQDYQQNFEQIIEISCKDVLKTLNNLMQQITQSKFETDMVLDKERVCLVFRIENMIYTFKQIFEYFGDQSINCFIKQTKLLHYIENIYYQSARALEIWKFEIFQQKLQQVRTNILQFFVLLLNHLQNQQNQKTELILEFLLQFGSLYNFGKKNQKDYCLLRHIQKRFDFQNFVFLLKIQESDKIKEFLDIIKTINKKQEEEEEEEQNKTSSESEIEEIKMDEQPKKIQLTAIRRDEPKIEVIDYEERQKMAVFIRQQMEREYDDEFDDAFIPRLKFENKQEELYNDTSSSDEEPQQEKKEEEKISNKDFQEMYKKNPYHRGNKGKYLNPKYNQPEDEPNQDKKQQKNENYKHYTHIVQRQKQDQTSDSKRDQGYAKEKQKKQKYSKHQ